MIEYRPLSEIDISDVLSLAARGLCEMVHHASLPAIEDEKAALSPFLTELQWAKLGYALIENGRLAAYLAFYGPFDNLFGNNNQGAWSPLFGNGTEGECRERTASRLLQYALQDMVYERGVSSVAITVSAFDREVLTSHVVNGFGLRCADAARDLSRPLDAACTLPLSFREIDRRDATMLQPFLAEHAAHLAQSPCFLYTDKAWEGRHIAQRIEEGVRFFVAFDEEKPVGYIEVGHEGENLLTYQKAMPSICGAHLLPAYRGTGAQACLLQLICDTLKAEGYTHLGVDYETINPTAQRSWTKYFVPYTYSLHRRIDERVME